MNFVDTSARCIGHWCQGHRDAPLILRRSKFLTKNAFFLEFGKYRVANLRTFDQLCSSVVTWSKNKLFSISWILKIYLLKRGMFSKRKVWNFLGEMGFYFLLLTYFWTDYKIFKVKKINDSIFSHLLYSGLASFSYTTSKKCLTGQNISVGFSKKCHLYCD